MKDLKTILEVGHSKSTNDNKTVSISLNKANISNILFALAYVYKNDNEANSFERKDYETLYTNLYKEAMKTFDKDDLYDGGIEEDIKRVQTRY